MGNSPAWSGKKCSFSHFQFKTFFSGGDRFKNVAFLQQLCGTKITSPYQVRLRACGHTSANIPDFSQKQHCSDIITSQYFSNPSMPTLGVA